ncbi:MAG: DUF1223 domain-containing protein [Granulosicoccus sp.]
MNQLDHFPAARAGRYLLLLWALAFVQPGAGAESSQLKVIELFTSHGCSSCPPAERLLGELLDAHSDLIGLEFHVDYWNDLVHGSDGNFIDPFSDPSFSERQRHYNASQLKGRPGVYTPQAIINGRVAAVGSSRGHIEKALNQRTPQLLQISFDNAEQSGQLRIVLSGDASARSQLQGVPVQLFSFIDNATTNITGGENRDLQLKNRNIVTNLQVLGAVGTSIEQIFTLPAPGPGKGCVVVVQEISASPIHAAATCP